MKNNGTIILSMLGGAALGSALTIYLAHKSGHVDSKMVHAKIIGEIEKIRDCIKQHLSEGCKCDIDQHAANDQQEQQ